MPHADTVLLPICVAIALIGIVMTGLAWRRGSKGRVLQGAALAIVPFGLYLTGLLRLLWDAAVALVRWAVRLAFSPTLWIGFGILGLCLVLFVIGTVLVRLGRRTGRHQSAVGTGTNRPAVGGRPQAPQNRTGGRAQAVDPELAEIEALLKSRGIE